MMVLRGRSHQDLNGLVSEHLLGLVRSQDRIENQPGVAVAGFQADTALRPLQSPGQLS